jgi:hypothetical protein
MFDQIAARQARILVESQFETAQRRRPAKRTRRGTPRRAA